MRNVFVLVACCLVGGTTCLPVSADEAEPRLLTGQDLIDRMAKAYSDCKSYRDTGVVKTVFVQATGNRIVEKPFKTVFVRPDRFRFEYMEKGEPHAYRHIVWRNGKDVKTWWEVNPGVRQWEALGLALATATGVSSGSAHVVPAMLFPKEVTGRRLTDIKEVKRLANAKLDEVDCFRIEGKFANSPITVWIDSKTFLARRIDQKKEFANFRTEKTTSYDPAGNPQMSDEELEFNPPEGK